ncbi:helix-turn-helix domain-containing protein [Nocardia otitidiscaviarum]|nr:helix-turn-helix domain-containing protein [Nocardia otitidiscaviarum]
MIGAATGLLIFADASSALGRALNARVRETGLPPGSAAAWVRAAAPLDRTPLHHPLGELPRDRRSGDTRPNEQLPGHDSGHSSAEPADAAGDTPTTHGPAGGGSAAGTLAADSGLAADLLARLVGDEGGGAGPEHPALRRALVLVPGMLDGPVRLTELAGAVGISASRLGHLFAAEVGMGFPPYLRWARLRHAMEHARRGGTLTAAAHAAGFADSAHLTRVCHEMFGLTPSELVRRVALVRS